MGGGIMIGGLFFDIILLCVTIYYLNKISPEGPIKKRRLVLAISIFIVLEVIFAKIGWLK